MGYYRFSVLFKKKFMGLKRHGSRWWVTFMFIEVHYSPKSNQYDEGFNIFNIIRR